MRVYETGRSLAAELVSQRRDLLGERRNVLARGLFNAVVGHLDAIRAMRLSLQEGKDRNDKNNKRMIKQLEAVEITLITALQGMEFHEFHAREGEPFSPVTMECLGYLKGEPGIVLRSVRSGFETPEGIARPAGVYIAEPPKGPQRNQSIGESIMSKPHLHKVIGIDLGTTYSAVASFNSMGDPRLGNAGNAL